jgi:hypothetical protein
MNKRIYLVTVRWINNNVSKHEILESQLATIGNWLRFSSWAWMVKTEIHVTADMVYNSITLPANNIEKF